MANGYRVLQQWNQWLTHQFLGQQLLLTEKEMLSKTLKRHFGKHALVVGVPNQYDLLNATRIPCHSLLTPLVHHLNQSTQIEGEFQHLPILTGSIDLVILPHTLELIDTPRHLLSEACRIVKPEGLIVIFGFNPNSLWGIRKMFTRQQTVPWSSNFHQPKKIKNWLRLAEFEMEKQRTAMHRPPITQPSVYERFQLFDKLGQYICPFFGGIYMLVARAKVIPLTPIRMKWKQQLSSIRISSSMTGHIARHSE